MREDKFITCVGGRGGVVPNTTHLSSKNKFADIDMIGGFIRLGIIP